MRIFCVSDLHLREDIPSCRDKLFPLAQEKKLSYLFELFYREKGDAIIDAGDFFHWNKLSVKFINYIIGLFNEFGITKDKYFLLMGNHDLPGYLPKEETAAYNLHLAGNISLLGKETWGETPLFITPFKNVFVIHKYIYKNEYEEKGGLIPDGLSGKQIFKMVPYRSVVISGHSHSHFYIKSGERVLLNPGGMTRQRKNDSERGFYIFDTDKGDMFERVFPLYGDIYDTTVLKKDIFYYEDEKFIHDIMGVEKGCYSFRENVNLLLHKRNGSKALRDKISLILEDLGVDV